MSLVSFIARNWRLTVEGRSGRTWIETLVAYTEVRVVRLKDWVKPRRVSVRATGPWTEIRTVRVLNIPQFLPLHLQLLSVFLKVHVTTSRNKKCRNQSSVAMSLPLTLGIVSHRDDSVLLYPMIFFLLELKKYGTKFSKLWKKDRMTEFSFL